MRNIPTGLDAAFLYLHDNTAHKPELMSRTTLEREDFILPFEVEEERECRAWARDAQDWTLQDSRIVFPGCYGCVSNLDTYAAAISLDRMGREYERKVEHVQLYPLCLERCMGSMNEHGNISYHREHYRFARGLIDKVYNDLRFFYKYQLFQECDEETIDYILYGKCPMVYPDHMFLTTSSMKDKHSKGGSLLAAVFSDHAHSF